MENGKERPVGILVENEDYPQKMVGKQLDQYELISFTNEATFINNVQGIV